MTASFAQRVLLASVGALLAAGVAGAAVHQNDGDDARTMKRQGERQPGADVNGVASSVPLTTAAPAGPAPVAEGTAPGLAGSGAVGPGTGGSGLATGGSGEVASGTAPLAATGSQPLALPGGFLLALGATGRAVLRLATRRTV